VLLWHMVHLDVSVHKCWYTAFPCHVVQQRDDKKRKIPNSVSVLHNTHS